MRTLARTVALVAILAALWMGAAVVHDRALRTELTMADSGVLQFGPKDADLVVVDFLDYKCPDCRPLHASLLRAAAADGHVRLLIRQLPIMDKESEDMSRLVLAAATKHKVGTEMHAAFVASPEPPDEKARREYVEMLGLNYDTLLAEGNTPDIQALLDREKDLWTRAGFRSIPVLVVGNRTYVQINYIPTPDEFRKLFAEARGG